MANWIHNSRGVDPQLCVGVMTDQVPVAAQS